MKLFGSVVAQVCLHTVLTSMVASEEDLYSILGIERTATDKQIGRAFRKLAQKYHPDHNRDPDAQEKFIQIARAYEVLGDAEKRRQYDSIGTSFGRASRDETDWQMPVHFNMHSFFSDFDAFAEDDSFGFHNAFHRSFHHDAHMQNAFTQTNDGGFFGFDPFVADDFDEFASLHNFAAFESSSNDNCRTSTILQGNTVITQTYCG